MFNLVDGFLLIVFICARVCVSAERVGWLRIIAWAGNTMFPSPEQPPMLYIKMCLFKFSLWFRVAPLEIWCTTFRKFEKTCFKSLWSLHCCLILYGSVDYKTTPSKLLLNVLRVLKISFLINKIDDFWLTFFSTIQT